MTGKHAKKLPFIVTIPALRVSASFVGHTAHCGTESAQQVLNGSHIFISLREHWYYLVLCPTTESAAAYREN